MATITGTAGADSLQGGDGDDVLTGGLGNDHLSGGGGTDVATFYGTYSEYVFAFSPYVPRDPFQSPRFPSPERQAEINITGPDGSDTVVASGGTTTFSTAPNGDFVTTINPGIFDLEFLKFFDLTVSISPTGGAIIQNPIGDNGFVGGKGIDVVQFSGSLAEYRIDFRRDLVSISGPGGNDTLSQIERARFSDIIAFLGSSSADKLGGTSDAEAILGGGGNDIIYGAGGDDILVGGVGDDILYGDGLSNNNDVYYGFNVFGNDTLVGGQGYDIAMFPGFLASAKFSLVDGQITVETGSSETFVYNGIDTIKEIELLRFGDRDVAVTPENRLLQFTSQTITTLYGTDIADILMGGSTNDTLLGGNGDDIIEGVDGNDNIIGQSGEDVLTGGAGNDVLEGGAGADRLDGGTGNDRLLGGDGDDLLSGGDGDDALDGGAGVDTASFNGNFDASRLEYANGGLTVSGPGGRDSLIGIERLQFADRTVEISADGFVLFNGTSAADVIQGSSANDRVDAGIGNDVVDGLGGDDFILGGSGADTLFGSRGRDAINGGDGSDNLYGGQGDDALNGGAGDDRLQGGAGLNTIDGGDGSDVLLLAGTAGGYRFAGNGDAFVVSRGASQQSVTHVERISFDGGATSSTVRDVMLSAFDPYAYVFENQDVLAAYGLDPVAARNHYETFGYNEGRDLGTFNALAYAASYVDLSAAFGSDARAAANHYLTRGINEGRTITFDASAYAAANPDIAAIAGFDADFAAAHYINFGRAEGRATSGFDPVAYLLSYPDLAGLTAEEARDHWLVTGAREGRLGDSVFGREQATHTLGSTTFDVIDRAYDYDWFEITLTAGQQYTINASAAGSGVGTLADGQVRLYDSTGQLLGQDSDMGPGGDAQLYYTAAETGTYYAIVNGQLGATGGYWFNYAAASGNGSTTLSDDDATDLEFTSASADRAIHTLGDATWAFVDGMVPLQPDHAPDWHFA